MTCKEYIKQLAAEYSIDRDKVILLVRYISESNKMAADKAVKEKLAEIYSSQRAPKSADHKKKISESVKRSIESRKEAASSDK